MIFTQGFLGEPSENWFLHVVFELGPPIYFYRRSLIKTTCKN